MKSVEHSRLEPFITIELFKVGATSVNTVTLVTAVIVVFASYLLSRAVRATGFVAMNNPLPMFFW